MSNSKYEVLAPAGSLEICKAVIAAGADAVYVGGAKFGARAYAENFGQEEMFEAIDHAHLHGRKLFMTVNTLLKNPEMEKELYEYLLPYYEHGLDAVIVQDLGVMQFIRRNFPKMDIHASTQMTICGVESAELLKELGANRVVTSRELSCEEIRAIHEAVEIEIESFVHGALCYCYSGQCLMSSMLGGRSGNRGRCAQPCRLPYAVLNERRKVIGREENYILSPKDLCTIEEIPALLESGIYSLKIEGRMKKAEYAAGVVSMYRKYVDLYEGLCEQYGAKIAKERYQVAAKDYQDLLDFGNRSGFTKGYYVQHNGPSMMTFESPSHAKGNDALQKEIRKLYVEGNLQEAICGTLSLHKEQPAVLQITYGALTFEVSGEIVQQAQKQPLDQQKVTERMCKTGNTPFYFERLEVEMDADSFLPVQALNQLRREALEQLKEKLVSRMRREIPAGGKQFRCLEKIERLEKRKAQVYVSLEERTGVEEVLCHSSVEGIYMSCTAYHREQLVSELDTDIEKIHAAGKKAGYILPAVFRKQTSDAYRKIAEELTALSLDYFVVKSLDELKFLKEYGVSEQKIVLDHNLYAYSDEACADYLELGVERLCVPLELNRKELQHYAYLNGEYVIYGYQTLMVSAQCVHKNVSGCDKNACRLYLKDRYGKEFMVRNCCDYCYNLIYNSTPLCLFGQKKELDGLGFANYRIQFTKESVGEIKKILDLYEDIFEKGHKIDLKAVLPEYTNGHFKRGVE